LKLKEKALQALRVTEEQLFLNNLAMDLLEDQLSKEEAAAKLLERVKDLAGEVTGVIP